MSGYWASGMAIIASAPAMAVTIAMTIDSRGRSTKTEDSIGSAPGDRPGDRTRPDGDARPHPLQPVDDDLLAAGEAVLDDHVGPALAPDLDAPHRGLAVLDDEHVDAALVGDERRLRHHDLLRRLAALEQDAHELAVAQRRVGVGDPGARHDGVGAAVDADVDEIDPTDLIVGR